MLDLTIHTPVPARTAPPYTPDPASRQPRVAAVPGGHPYVRHIGAGEALPDPQPDGAPAGRWWPPAMLDPAWIAANADAFDLLHLHFGTESFTVGHLQATVAALRDAGRPFVHTVHDLAHPQLGDQRAYEAQLDVLVPGADALITLTQGAADRIAARWGRHATVIPHPHLLPLDVPAPAGDVHPVPVIGIHLRDLRPNVDGPGTVRALAGALRILRARGADVRGRVELHDRVRDEAARDAVLAACDADPLITARIGPRPGDAALWHDLADLDAAVLPYAHGTHSGWAELCFDLGVPVAAPRVGHLAEQHGDPAFNAGDPATLAGALDRALRSGTRPGSTARHALVTARRAQRREQHQRIAEAHATVYARALSRCA